MKWSVDGMCLSANRWAKFMGYPDERVWLSTMAYRDLVLDGVSMRGTVYKGGVRHQIAACCHNQASGELEAK